MQQLVKVTQGALAEEETGSVGIQQRNLISDSLRYLNQHEAALVKGYPTRCAPKVTYGPCSGWSAIRVCPPKSGSSGCSTCGTCWASCS